MADGERRPLLRGPSATAAPPPLPSAPTFSLLSFSRSISRGISRYGALYSRIDAELEMRAGEVEIGELRADEGGDGATLKKPGAHPHVAAHSKLGALAVGVMCFASIAGGPVGIEPAVGAVGALPTILALVAAAFVWSATQALVATELATMFPSNAGECPSLLMLPCSSFGPLSTCPVCCAFLPHTRISSRFLPSMPTPPAPLSRHAPPPLPLQDMLRGLLRGWGPQWALSTRGRLF